MKNRRSRFKWRMVYLFMAALAQLAAAATGFVQPAAAQGFPPVKKMTWQLMDAQVVSSGHTMNTDKGQLVEGYVIEARALAEHGGLLVQEGTYTLNLTAFQPQEALPGQEAGLWYLRGSWTLTDDQTEPAMRKTRHNPATINGFIVAELPFNPLSEAGLFDAEVKVPMAPGAAGWAAGNGTFSGNEKFEGTLSVNFNRAAGGRGQGGAK